MSEKEIILSYHDLQVLTSRLDEYVYFNDDHENEGMRKQANDRE